MTVVARNRNLAGLLAGFAFLAGAMIAPARAQQSWDQVIEAAKKEGTLFVYHAQSGAPHYLPVVKSFEEKYGIKVESIETRASEMTERIRVEQTTGRYIADMEFNGSATLENQALQGYIDPIGDIPNARNIRAPFEADKWGVPAWTQVYGFLVNTSLVKPGDEPHKWSDLLDPKWKGKILADDPRAIGGGQTNFYVTYKTFGREFQEKLAGQKPVFSRDIRADARRVARGEYPLYIPQMFGYASDLKGLPIKVIVPEDGSPYVLIKAAIVKGARHPNAARLFINHFLDVQSQLQYANAWMGVTVNGVIEKLTDPDAKRFAAASLIGTTQAFDQQKMLDVASQMYK